MPNQDKQNPLQMYDEVLSQSGTTHYVNRDWRPFGGRVETLCDMCLRPPYNAPSNGIVCQFCRMIKEKENR